MRKTPCFLVFLIFWTLLAICCVDQKGTDTASNVSSMLETPFTLAEITKTTLAPPVADNGGIYEISRRIDSGRLDEALVLAQKNASPEVVAYLNNAGVNYTQEKRYEEADKIFTKILDMYPNQPDIWYNKGIVAAKLGRHDEAVLAYGKATDLKPTDSEAWYQKASSLYYLKRYDEAIDACNRSLTLEPKNPYAWYNLGIALTELKRYNESIQAYDKALSLKSDYAEAENNKGNVLSELGLYKDAIAAYDMALSIRDDNQTKKNKELAENKLKDEKPASSQNISLSSQ
jgi:tetratricopeptide (TPR) repeat protein